MHPEFTYTTKKYHPSDVLDETVLNSAKEMFDEIRDEEEQKQ